MNFAQAKQFILTAPVKKAILLTGNHGIGKSELVQQVALEMGGDFVDLRLSQNDVGDLKGMPFLVAGRTFFAPPNWFPVDEASAVILSALLKSVGQEFKGDHVQEKGILFLDELNRATRECEQVAFQLVLDRCLNFINLPPGWRVVAAINDNTDIYNANEMDPALLARFAVVPLNPTVDEWLEYAKRTEVHQAVIQFISTRPDCLDVKTDIINNKRKEKLYDRRSWTHLSDTIKEYEKQDKDWMRSSNDYRRMVFQAFIGVEMSSQFNNFVEHEYVTLNAKKIMEEWDDTVAKHLKRAKIAELAGYNKMLIDYIKDDAGVAAKKELNRVQSENLVKYVKMVSKEITADFWNIFSKELPQVSHEWYNKTQGGEVVLDAMRNPNPKPRK